ncbi:hypothetical protein PVK06_008649 [Gossypium arboreum]|uniref:Uncharacterized protein n=1 Tax=Gossypium arboreum TaxID=29729 RepID=A0ABR0QLC8_GOSAR|nr:hypothetical protein PVK06_008649 [Gossypium arboreum]
MSAISSSTMRILWNEVPTHKFRLTRVVRQTDDLILFGQAEEYQVRLWVLDGIISRIMGILLPHLTLEPDRIIWGYFDLFLLPLKVPIGSFEMDHGILKRQFAVSLKVSIPSKGIGLVLK